MERVDVGQRFIIKDNSTTREWIENYGREGLRVGHEVEVSKSGIYRDSLTAINVRNLTLGNGETHGISFEMIEEINELKGADEF